MAEPKKPIDYAVLADAEYQDQGALQEPQALVPEVETPKGESCDEDVPPPQ